MGFAWNLILFSFMREREGYKHHADCTVAEEDTIPTKIEEQINKYTNTQM